MYLSIITINYNNAEGLRKTLASVASQTYPHIEHIIIDGDSTDNSVEVIREYESSLASRLCGVPKNARGDLGCSSLLASRLKWLSEKDTGIYNAMNKGLEIALGRRIVNEDHISSPIANNQLPIAKTDYIQILNSGDILAAPDVTERMMAALEAQQAKGERLEAKGEENGKADTPASTLYTLHSTPTEISTTIYTNLHNSTPPTHTVCWISEKDTGIYNAMNKGIRMATGDYIQILNSGDILTTPDVTERMMAALEAQQVKGERLEAKGEENGKADTPVSTPYTLHSTPTEALSLYQNRPAILYGNMIKVNAVGEVIGKSGYTEYSLRQFYSSTLNHDCAYIRADLFEEYGLYDENLKIVSDWKWYLQAIGLGRVKPEYVDIDMTIFDDGGISETNLVLRNKERRQVLEELLPPAVLWDYDTHAFEMEQMNRLRRWKLYPLVYFMERVCFKLEKWGILGERRKVRG